MALSLILTFVDFVLIAIFFYCIWFIWSYLKGNENFDMNWCGMIFLGVIGVGSLAASISNVVKKV